MPTSLRLYTRVVVVVLALMMAAVAVRAQSGKSTVVGVVADGPATSQGKFVVVAGAKVELGRGEKDSPTQFTATTDDRGEYRFQRIPYGTYVLSVSAPGYLPYTLKFYASSDGRSHIAVLLRKN
jgi:Carboxypeptidase regulatory-like domain